MRVLIVKMSSMGDILHCLPAVTDASKALSHIQFDWVVEEAFTEIPAWHSHIHNIIPIALRRWRKQPWQSLQHGEIQHFYQNLRAQSYDLVIDAQASIKSALVTRLTRGLRCGMDKQSEHEKFVHLAYQKTFAVERKQHAIKRLRELFAQVFGYTLANLPLDYGIDLTKLAPAPLPLPENYVVFVPNTPWPNKQWSEANWAALLNKVSATGMPILLPWGNSEEKTRVTRLANTTEQARVLPKLKLSEIATVLAQAKAVVCVDTGLSHLTAALNVPAITLYNATDPSLIGALSDKQIHLQNASISHYRQKNSQTSSITPQQVWEALQPLLAS